jgi:hypothetical protein
MDPSYSAFADWLSKVHTAPPLIQALWILAGPATVVGVTACIAWAAREIAAIRAGARRAAEPEGIWLHAVDRTPEGRRMLPSRGRARELEDRSPPQGALTSAAGATDDRSVEP